MSQFIYSLLYTEISRTFVVAGLLFDIIGTYFLVRGLIITRKEALKLGVSRLSGTTDEENLKLPEVQDRIKQSRNSIAGGILLGVGFILQVISQFL